jgi:hypothetical protein
MSPTLATPKATIANAVTRSENLLPDERGQPLPGMHGQAGDHLLDDHVRDRDQHHEEQRPVDELRPRRGIGDDAAGVVARGSRDQSWSGSGQIDEAPSREPADLMSDSLGKWNRPFVGTSASRTSSAKIRPTGSAVIVHNDKGEPTGLHELAGHIVGRRVRTYGHHVFVGQERGDPGVG